MIDAGIIKKNKGSPEEEDAVFEIRYMNEDHLDEMMALQDVIVQSLADKEIHREIIPIMSVFLRGFLQISSMN